MTLADMQRDFQSWLTSTANVTVHAATDDANSHSKSDAATQTVGNTSSNASVAANDDSAIGAVKDEWRAAANRLGTRSASGFPIYQNNYRAQLVGCLEISFPLVHGWLGDDAFLQAAVTHIEAHPPYDWTLDAYPAHFGATLATLYPNNPDLYELAWIELALSDAFVAADAEPIALDALASIDWDTARIRFVPSLEHRHATTNANDIWSALAQDQAPPEAVMLNAPAGLIVWRKGFTSHVHRVDALELEAIEHVRQHGDFASLCDRLVSRLGDEDGVTRAGTMLATWLNNAMVTTIAN
jgi:hypothetical protein